SNEGDQNKPGPSGLTKKRKIADREVNSDVQQAIIDDSPSTSAGTRSKRASSSSKVAQPKTHKSPPVSQKAQSNPGKRPRDDLNKPSPGLIGMAKKRKARLEKANEPSDEETEDEMIDEDDDKPRAPIKTLALQCTEPDCVEMVPDYGALHSHILNHHGLPRFRCPACGVRFDIQ